MRDACSLARRVLTEASKLATVGTTTNEIDDLVNQLSFDALIGHPLCYHYIGPLFLFSMKLNIYFSLNILSVI